MFKLMAEETNILRSKSSPMSVELKVHAYINVNVE